MCLKYPLKGKRKEKAIAALPKTFFVWKYFPKGMPQYHDGLGGLRIGERYKPKITESPLKLKVWHKAKNCPRNRTLLDYEVGFHAFTDHDAVFLAYKNYDQIDFSKFEARREDVIEIGRFNEDYYDLKGVVLRRIKPA